MENRKRKKETTSPLRCIGVFTFKAGLFCMANYGSPLEPMCVCACAHWTDCKIHLHLRYAKGILWVVPVPGTRKITARLL